MNPIGLNIALTPEIPLVAEICNLAVEMVDSARSNGISVLTKNANGVLEPTQVHLMFIIPGDTHFETVEFDVPVFMMVGTRPQVLAQWLIRRFNEHAVKH